MIASSRPMLRLSEVIAQNEQPLCVSIACSEWGAVRLVRHNAMQWGERLALSSSLSLRLEEDRLAKDSIARSSDLHW